MSKRGQVVGYVSVSTAGQDETRQLEAIGEADRLFSEKVSEKSTSDRERLKEMLAYVREGDAVRVKSPDRLAHSTTDLLSLVDHLSKKGVAVEFVDNPALNTDAPQGEFMLTILAAVARLERATFLERQAEGIEIAKRNGIYDRAPKLTAKARQRADSGVPKARRASDLGISHQTLYAALGDTGKYAELVRVEA